MVINRVKGHGKRATYILRPPLTRSWHVKLRPITERQILLDEAARLKWVRHKLPSTKSVAYIPAGKVGLLMTRTISGKPGHELIGELHPAKIVESLVEATKSIQKANTEGMNFEAPRWAIDRSSSLLRLKNLNELQKNGKELHPDFKKLSKKKLTDILEQGPKKPKELVLTHGDLCMPNLLFSDEGELTGVIDLGAMHLNDRFLDVALMSWCIRANMGEKWSDLYLSEFETDNQDPAIQYYRLVYDLSLNFPEPWRWVEKPKLIKQRERLARI